MKKIAKIINPNEKVIAVRRPHWIYLAWGVFWFILMSGIGIMADELLFRYAGSVIPPETLWFNVDWGIVQISRHGTPIPLFGIATGLAVMLPYFLTYISTVIVLTGERFIHKTGLIFVQIVQVDLEDIRAEHVDHGYLGWLIGYATIRFDCRFIEDVRLPAIAKPYALIKATHNVRYKHPQIEYEQDEFERDLQMIDEDHHRYSRAERFKVLKQRMGSSFHKAAEKRGGNKVKRR